MCELLTTRSNENSELIKPYSRIKNENRTKKKPSLEKFLINKELKEFPPIKLKANTPIDIKDKKLAIMMLI